MTLKKELEQSLKESYDKYLYSSEEESLKNKKKYLAESFDEDIKIVSKIIMKWQVVIGYDFTKSFLQDIYKVVSMSEQITDYAMDKVTKKLKTNDIDN